MAWPWLAGEWQDGIEHCLKSERWARAWDDWAASRPEVLKESMIDKYRLKLKGLVISHVDKHPGEGMIM